MLNFTETKWKIIKELTKSNKTPTQLSKKLNISLPSIHRELVDLTRKGFIKKNGKVGGKTRPFFEYSIREFVYFAKALEREVDEKFLPIDENLKLHLRIWSIPQQEFHYFIEGFWWGLVTSAEEYLNDIESIAVFGSVARGDARPESDIDALILTKKRWGIFEENLSAIIVNHPKKKEGKVIMTKIFSPEDFKVSLKKGSRFAKEILKDLIIIYDPNNFLQELKNGFEGKTS